METRDKRRGRVLNSIIANVKQHIDQSDSDDEFQAVLMKLFLDLQKKKRSLVQITEEEA